jgi:hypothetical protein
MGDRDPWVNRSEGMKCKTCMWFVPKITNIQDPSGPCVDGTQNIPIINIGRCRRHAPTMNGYPVVFVNDWCGDHKLNEEAV